MSFKNNKLTGVVQEERGLDEGTSNSGLREPPGNSARGGAPFTTASSSPTNTPSSLRSMSESRKAKFRKLLAEQALLMSCLSCRAR